MQVVIKELTGFTASEMALPLCEIQEYFLLPISSGLLIGNVKRDNVRKAVKFAV